MIICVDSFYKNRDKMMSFKTDKYKTLESINREYGYRFKYVSQAYRFFYIAGFSATIIGNFFDVTAYAVFHQLRKMNVKLRSKGGPNNKLKG